MAHSKAEIILDLKIWKAVEAQLSPTHLQWLRENKGKSQNKLINSVALIKVSKIAIEQAEIMNQVFRSSIAVQLKASIGVRNQYALFRSIEKAIVVALIRVGHLPESTTFCGKAVVQPATACSNAPAIERGFVYFIRNGDLHKIGITENLLRRMSELQPDEILNVVRCVNYRDVERLLHSKLKSSRIPQSEYFRLDSLQVEQVHAAIIELAQF